MNILFLLTPKKEVDYLYGDFTVRQALEKMRERRYSMLPVIDRKSGKYLRAIMEGDFLYYLAEKRYSFDELERHSLSEIPSNRLIQAVTIDSTIEQLYSTISGQNFVPVIDDNGTFIGIVTRKSVMKVLLSNVR